jgi:hypothetical protein
MAPTCMSLAWRSPPIPGVISLDEVKDGGKDRIGKWFKHLAPFFFAVLASVFSPMNFCVALLKARALITCLITNFIE